MIHRLLAEESSWFFTGIKMTVASITVHWLVHDETQLNYAGLISTA